MGPKSPFRKRFVSHSIKLSNWAHLRAHIRLMFCVNFSRYIGPFQLDQLVLCSVGSQFQSIAMIFNCRDTISLNYRKVLADAI